MPAGHTGLTRSARVNSRFSFGMKTFAVSFPDHILGVGKATTFSPGGRSHRCRTCPKAPPAAELSAVPVNNALGQVYAREKRWFGKQSQPDWQSLFMLLYTPGGFAGLSRHGGVSSGLYWEGCSAVQVQWLSGLCFAVIKCISRLLLY